MLEHWTESDVHSRQGEAVANFSNALLTPQCDLAKEIVRDPYSFDFLTLCEPIAERELEEGLGVRHRKTHGADRGARRIGFGKLAGEWRGSERRLAGVEDGVGTHRSTGEREQPADS